MYFNTTTVKDVIYISTLGHQYDNSLVSNAFGFLRLPMNFMPYDSDADWVITGVPFDMATSGRAGGRHGPAAIRQVSTNLAWEHNRFPWNFDMRERLNVVDCGDLVYAFGDAREMSEKLQAHAEKLLAAGKRMLSFGGDAGAGNAVYPGGEKRRVSGLFYSPFCSRAALAILTYDVYAPVAVRCPEPAHNVRFVTNRGENYLMPSAAMRSRIC